MVPILNDWFAAARRRHREKVLIDHLLRLDDHLLADAGFRRDQLQPDGIHELDAAPRPLPEPKRPAQRAVVRPSLQGCG